MDIFFNFQVATVPDSALVDSDLEEDDESD
jgi:hypothetical protein